MEENRERSSTSLPERGSVLIVDSDDELALEYARVLRRAGYKVTTASDGKEASELVRREPWDLILSDISTPGMTGIELLRSVRTHDLDVPVILMTGDPELESVIQALEYGALRYMRKPIDPEDLRQAAQLATQLGRVAKTKRKALELLGAEGMMLGDRAGLEARFTNALETLWLGYQPIVMWSERRVFAYEALVRNDEATLARPDALFEAATRLDRLWELSRAIRRRVLASAPFAPEKTLLFVNLHPHDLLDDLLFSPQEPLRAIADRTVFEVTERASLEDIKDLHSRANELRRCGFRLAVDDLGAGYAGLTSFAVLEPEVVKLDMSLVRGVDENATKQKLIRSFLDLCKDLRKLAICEGVETVNERDTLVGLGCDLFQGYLFARPARGFPSVTWGK